MNVNKIWVKFRIRERQRHIPLHRLAKILGAEKLRALLNAHILTPNLDPNQQPSKHAQKNIYMSLEKSFTVITSRWQKSTW